MTALLSIIVALAALAWCVAVWSALCVIGLSPRGEKLGNLFRLGWWQFAAIEAAAGPGVVSHLSRYRSAFLVFFACVLSAAVLGILMAS